MLNTVRQVSKVVKGSKGAKAAEAAMKAAPKRGMDPYNSWTMSQKVGKEKARTKGMSQPYLGNQGPYMTTSLARKKQVAAAKRPANVRGTAKRAALAGAFMVGAYQTKPEHKKKK